MPSVSRAQRRFMAMCEHNPGAAKGACPDMTKKQFHDFASTSEAKLPFKVTQARRKSLRGSGPMSHADLQKGHRKLETCAMGMGRQMMNPKK